LIVAPMPASQSPLRGDDENERPAPLVFRLRMPSQREAVAPTVDRIIRAVGPAGLNSDQLSNLAIALAEALSNAAVHGHGLDVRRQVRVLVTVEPQERAVIEVRDSGNGFDAEALSDPTDPARVLVPDGRGVFLMRKLVDRLEYNEAGNRVRLTVERRP